MTGYVCTVAIAPVRKEPSDRSEMTSQFLFGETMQLLEEQEKWWRVKSDLDGYEGWIDPKQVQQCDFHCDTEGFSLARNCWRKVTNLDRQLRIPLGSLMRNYKREIFYPFGKEKWYYSGQAVEPGKSDPHKIIREIGTVYIGSPYLWGGRTTFGVDCSGLVQQVFRYAGINLPRDAWQQAEVGEEVPFQKMQKHDLAFFFNADRRIVHVGIVWEVKKQLILHASGEVKLDRLEPEGIISLTTGEQTHSLAFIKRLPGL